MGDNKRLALSVLWVVLGAALVALSIAEVLDSTIYAGMGGALMAIGALQVVRRVRYGRDEAYRERVDIELSDERNDYLRKEAWARTGYIVVILESVAALVALILGNRAVQLTLAYSVALMCFVYWVTWMVLSKRN